MNIIIKFIVVYWFYNTSLPWIYV